MNLRRSLENLFRGQAVLLTTRSKDDPHMAVPVTSDNPLPVTVLDGSVGGGAGGTDPDSAREATLQEVLTHMQAANGNSFVLANQALNEGVHVRPAADVWAPAAPLSAAAGTSSAALPNPHGAKLRSATVHVVSGALYRNVGADAGSTCPRLDVGDSERLTAAQYAAYRVLRAGDTDAGLHIEFEVQP